MLFSSPTTYSKKNEPNTPAGSDRMTGSGSNKLSKVMLHEPLILGGVGGSATSIQRTAESIMETKQIITKLLVQDTGNSIELIEQAISYDNYMNAEQAVKFGICDAVVSRI